MILEKMEMLEEKYGKIMQLLNSNDVCMYNMYREFLVNKDHKVKLEHLDLQLYVLVVLSYNEIIVLF